MCVAGIYRPPNNPSADFTHFIRHTFDYRHFWLTVFVGDFYVVVLGYCNATRNFSTHFISAASKPK